MRAAFGADQAPYERYGRELERIVRNRYAQIIDAAPDQLQGWDGIIKVLEPMQSLNRHRFCADSLTRRRAYSRAGGHYVRPAGVPEDAPDRAAK